MARSYIASLSAHINEPIVLRGWVYRLRVLAKTSFIIVKDCTGLVQCVAASDAIKEHHLKLDDAIEITGRVREEKRSRIGYEVDVLDLQVINPAVHNLPFNSCAEIDAVGLDTILAHRPLSVRNEKVELVFKIQAAIVKAFRDFLTERHFTEIFTSKIVGSGTEGGTNLFELKYFERVAYLAQSPQFYKEHGVAGFERVFETGHVYRAEPHATVRHLTEYYSLDFEMGFIEGPEDVIQMERELLTYIFAELNFKYGAQLKQHNGIELPSMLKVPIWEFSECLEMLKKEFGRDDLIDDFDPEAEKQICQIAQQQTGLPAVFVIGYPIISRPFYTHPRTGRWANSFDLLFHGLEITTGGQRLHKRIDLEHALRSKGFGLSAFEEHLRMFDFGMPPHGGLAIGLERLTAQIMNLPNIRLATMYPRDRNRVSP